MWSGSSTSFRNRLTEGHVEISKPFRWGQLRETSASASGALCKMSSSEIPSSHTLLSPVPLTQSQKGNKSLSESLNYSS